MLGRLLKVMLVTFATELGGSLIQAGRGWLDKKLAPPAPTTPAPAEEAPAEEPEAR